MENLAKFFKHDFKNGYFELFNKNGNRLYYEDSDGYWSKTEYDENINIIYYENSDDKWVKRKYDKNNNRIYYEDSDGYWSKRKYDENNRIIYYENSNGSIEDNRPTCVGKIVEIDGKKYRLEEI